MLTMAVPLKTQLITELEKWCSEVVVNPVYALALSGVPEETAIADVEETVETVKAFGRVHVRRANKFIPLLNCEMMLCECRNPIDPARGPPEIIPPSGGSPWKLTLLTGPGTQSDEFSQKLYKLLESEGKTSSDTEPLLTRRHPSWITRHHLWLWENCWKRLCVPLKKIMPSTGCKSSQS